MRSWPGAPRLKPRSTERRSRGSGVGRFVPAWPREPRGSAVASSNPTTRLSQPSPPSVHTVTGFVDNQAVGDAGWWTSPLCWCLRTSILNLARRGRHSLSNRTGEQSLGRSRETGPTTARPPATGPAADRRSRAIAVAGAPVGRQSVPAGAFAVRCGRRSLLGASAPLKAPKTRLLRDGPGRCSGSPASLRETILASEGPGASDRRQ